eukprot:jgi/Botrbrau1/18359/Bobra.0179s0084.1
MRFLFGLNPTSVHVLTGLLTHQLRPIPMGRALFTSAVLLVSLVQVFAAQAGNPTDASIEDRVINVLSRFQSSDGGFDFLNIISPLSAQFFHATIYDTIPTLPWVQQFFTFKSVSSTIDICQRKDLAKCFVRGNASNGLPERLQGIWWSDGLDTTSQAFSTAGIWYPEQRKLTFPYYANAEDPTSSEFVNGTWTSSGAQDLNFLITYVTTLNLYLNEDYSFAQIQVGFPLAGIPVEIPVAILDFTMRWMGNDQWERKTSILGVGSEKADYILKRVVNGNGSNGPWFSDWLKYKGGAPVAIASIFRP